MARPLKDLEHIQERGSFRLTGRQVRWLGLGVLLLVVLAVGLGIQIGLVISPAEPEVSTMDVAEADRTIGEILEAYQAMGARDARAVTASSAADPAAGADAETGSADPAAAEPDENDASADPAAAEPDASAAADTSRTGRSAATSGLPAPGKAGDYAVQLAAYPTRAEAAAIVDALRDDGIEAFLMEAQVRGQTWYRVRVGSFSRRADAQAWLGAVTGYTPFDPIVVRD